LNIDIGYTLKGIMKTKIDLPPLLPLFPELEVDPDFPLFPEEDEYQSVCKMRVK